MSGKLVVPAIRGIIGDWTYYICLLRMKDVAERISDVADIHSNENFKDMLQRRLTDRSQDIAKYLVNQSQRFFNAIVVGTYGGNPNWFELDINVEGSVLDPLPDYIEGTLGILSFDGTENLWAIDGQHRVSGIKQAIKQKPDLDDEEICAIFVSGVSSSKREKDPDGFERTRRLFTTLNKYAKKVTKRDIIALDEDDLVAIITRFVIDEFDLLKDRISVGHSRSIPPSDKNSLTTIEIIYDVLDIILKDKTNIAWKKYKAVRPPEDELEHYQERSISYLTLLSECFQEIGDYLENEELERAAEPYRNESGGHLIFRPIGFLLVSRVIKLLLDHDDYSLEEAVSLVSEVPMQLANSPWGDLLWDVRNGRMLTSGPNQKVAKWLMYFIVGGDLPNIGRNVNYETMRREYVGIVKEDIDLRQFRIR